MISMKKFPNEIILVRHGENEIDSSKLNGELSLSKNGIIQAKWAAKALAQSVSHIDGVFTSNSKRTIETAQIISPVDNIIRDDRLLERGWGDNNTTGNETTEEVQLRLKNLFDEIFEKYNEKIILLITHGGIVKEAQRLLESNAPYNNQGYSIDNCKITRYSRTESETGEDVGYYRWKNTVSPFETQ